MIYSTDFVEVGLDGKSNRVQRRFAPTELRNLPGPSQLDDPLYAGIAWSRYWRLMRWMSALTFICISAALGFLYYLHGLVSVHMYIAAAAGVGLAVLLTAALMGLVFLSSGTGHDDCIDDPVSQDISPDE